MWCRSWGKGWPLNRMKNGNRKREEEKDKKKRKKRKSRNREREEFWQGRGGLKRALAFPLEEVLMPYWMQLLKNRCAVCGHRDPGSTSCMATHPMEVHLSRAGRASHQPPSGLRWRDSRTAGPSPRPAGREGCSPATPRLQLQSVSNHE